MTDNAVNNTEEEIVGGGLFDNKEVAAKEAAEKAAETKAVETKAVEEKKVEEKPEEKKTEEKKSEILLKLPEGSKLDAKRVDEIAAFAKERGLSQEAAQAVLERESKLDNDARVKFEEDNKQFILGLRKASESDKELGGENFGKNAELAKRFLKKFGSEALLKDLEDTGLGNHPELFRLCYRAGLAMGNDSFVQPGSAQTPESKNLADKFYPASKKE